MTTCVIDTNVLLRFVLGEPAAQADRARALFAAAVRDQLAIILPSMIVAEAVYVLDSFYGVPRRRIAEQLAAAINLPGVQPDEPTIVIDALAAFAATKFDFADVYVLARASNEAHVVASFDRRLMRRAGDATVDWPT